MFTSFDEKVFWEAIKEKDYVCLKVNTVSSILDDPTFARGETMEVLKILDAEVPEIFEDEIRLDYEERLEQSEWDKRYFTKLTYWFQENFAKSRVKYIKEVGKVVHKDTAQKYEASLVSKPASNTREKSQPENPKQAPTGKKRKTLIRKIFVAAVALVLIGALLLLLRKLLAR